MPCTPEPLLTPISGAQAALGGVGRTKIYELVHRREIIKVRLDGRSFIITESLTDYVDRLAAEASAPTDDSDETDEAAGEQEAATA